MNFKLQNQYNLNEWINTVNLIKTSLKYLLNYDDQVINTLRNDFNLISVYYFIVITGGNN